MRFLPLAVAAGFATACGNGGTGAAGSLPNNRSAADETTETAEPQVETFASGLVHPWALAVLPDGGCW